jgi:hypothetical protein
VRLIIAPLAHEKMRVRSIRRSTQAASSWGFVPRWSPLEAAPFFHVLFFKPSSSKQGSALKGRDQRSLRGL